MSNAEERSVVARSANETGKMPKTVKDPYDVDPKYPESKLKEKYGPKQYENQMNVESTLNKYLMRFRKSEMSVQKLHKKWEVIDLFDRGEQWKDHNIPPWIPKPITNFIKYVRTTKRANLASGISHPQFTPLHFDDVSIIQMLQMAHDHVWNTERIDREIRRCIDRALLYGTSVLYVYEDDDFVGGKYYGKNDDRNMLFQGCIRTKRWPIQNFFPDPDAYRIDDCKWIDTTEIIALRDVKNNPTFIEYCESMGWLDRLNALNYAQLEREDASSGVIFERDYTPLDTPRNVPGDEIVTMHVHWERYFEKGQWHLDVTYWLRNTDFLLCRIEDVKPSCYPFAILYDEEEENDIWGTSTGLDILENQKIINKLEQTAAILGTMHQNPQKVVYRESGINAQELARTGTLPGKVWQSNVPGEQAITVVQPLPIPQELFTLDDRTQSNINQIVGINEAYSGQAPGSVTTSTGVNDLVERATIRDKDKMIQIDAFVEQISDIILKFILYKWKEKRPIAIIGRNGSPQFGIYEPIKDEQQIQNLHWHVRSDVYAKAPTTQAQRRQQANQLMQMQGQSQFQPALITPEEFIRMNEFQDENEILQRMSAERNELQQQKAQDLAQQITQVANQIHQAKSQGASDQQTQQMAQQLAQQLLGEQQQQQAKNGMTPTPSGTGSNGMQAEAQPGMPQGTIGAVQAANMAKG